MINASDPVEYVPNGRLTVHNHPDFNKNELYQHAEVVYSEKATNVYTRFNNFQDFWILRDNRKHREEELYCLKKLAVYSQGSNIGNTLQVSYYCETNIQHAVWCKFHIEDKSKLLNAKECNKKMFQTSPIDSVCLFDSYTLNVFTNTGENYMSTLEFKVTAVWPTKYGILIEKSLQPVVSQCSTSMESAKNVSMLSSEEFNSPMIYSLTHPLDEICPVLIKQGNTSHTWDTKLRIIFTSNEPSLAFIHDTKTGMHSIYRIRKAKSEEYQFVNVSIDDNTSQIYNSIFSPPTNCISSTGIGTKNMNAKVNFNNLGTPSSFRSKTTSHINYTGNISVTSQHLSRSHSPMATISRCHSPTNAVFSTMSGTGHSLYNRTQHNLLANSLGQSEKNSYFKKYHNQYYLSGTSIPELCLDNIWTENIESIKNIDRKCASKVFLTIDLLGQSYFCYFVESTRRLSFIRLEKANDPTQIILGLVTTMIAKDIVHIPKLNMLAIMEVNGHITMYSGTTFIGKLHMPNIVSKVIGNNYILTNFYERELLSPYPRRSSLISPNTSSTPDIKFYEGVHLLSPVGGTNSNINFIETSSSDLTSISLKSAVSNKLILEYDDSTLLQITLPTFKASPLVIMCLRTLQNILPRDLGTQLLIKWYVARNAPGPQDLTINQEWNLFLVTFCTFFGYDVSKLHITVNTGDHSTNNRNSTLERQSPIVVPKKQKIINNGSTDDWSYLMSSDVSGQVDIFLYDVIGLYKCKECNEANTILDSESFDVNKKNLQSTFMIQLPHILFSLHLLYEELKLIRNMSENLFLLAKLLYQLSLDLNVQTYTQHYFSDFPILNKIKSLFHINDTETYKISMPNFISSSTPNIFKFLYNLFTLCSISSYPYLINVNPISKKLIEILSMFNKQNSINILELDHYFKTIHHNVSQSKDSSERNIQGTMEDIIMCCYKTGFTKRQLENLPCGINFILSNIIYQSRQNPPSNWPTLVYELIDRQDLATLQKKTTVSCNFGQVQNRYIRKNYNFVDTENNDGMEFDYTILQLRFNKDHRVREIRKLLDSSEPVKISIVQRPDVSDHEFIEEQEKFLYALCIRTMALPTGRGMFTLRTSMPINTEQLPIPRLCLTGKAPPRGTTVQLTHIDVPSNMNLWPLFHNGVATGLCIHPDSLNVDSTWIVYNKQQQDEFGIEHSGFLMALGLNGHLKNLAPFSMYEYLVECHEATSVGLLLGLSATHRSSMDVSMTKLLSLHVETLLPPTSIELNVQQNVQVAALMGVGLVYQGTNHRHIAHALLSEIGRPPGPEMKNCVDRESYSLTAGLALGLVVLSSGGGADLGNIPDTLHYYMIGGNSRPFCGSQKDKYKSPSYQIREGDSINVDVTSPGATIALGLMYLKSGNTAVAEWMTAPNTQYLLDFVRPDLLLLRILAKALIMWDDIKPSKTWISSHVPDIVSKYKLQKPTVDTSEPVDFETINQAYCNIIAGACMAMGLKYAGTENLIAFKTLYHFLKMFITLSHKSISELAGKATIETCLNVVLLSAAIVMAGTGNLEILRVCRHIRSRVGPNNCVVTYGSHVAIHMALGFLFLGGGSHTLSNDPSSIAALVISLFPKFPTHSNDNRYHLQALRHLYVLATEPRLLLPKDIDTGKFCYAKIRLSFKCNNQREGQNIVLKAPCMLPQLDCLNKIEIDDDRYWKIIFEKGRNFNQLKNILKANCVLNVKQRVGCLSYIEDPQGFRSLLAQTLTTEDIILWRASLQQIVSFTVDTAVLNFVNRFLKKGDLSYQLKYDHFCINKIHDRLSSLCFAYVKTTEGENFNHSKQIQEIYQIVSKLENDSLQNLITITYESVIRDKINFLPLLISIYKILAVVEKQQKLNFVWQMKLISAFRFCKYFQDSGKLLNIENILANKQRMYCIMDNWESDILLLINNILNIKCNNKTDIEVLKRVFSYILTYDVPCQLECFNLNIPDNPVQNLTLSCLTIDGAYRISTLSRKHPT